jgi:glycosyltransferase involved in cell wall biosynthesis
LEGTLSKVAFVGHSFHEKTGSTLFFIDLLKKHFDVEVILNDSWATGTLPKVEHLDDSYETVVLFQLVTEELLSAISARNIVYIPMADYIIYRIDTRNSGPLSWRPYSFWEMLSRREVKVLNFSESINRLCVNLGIQSKFVQYYPLPAENPDFKDEISVFYWERDDSITPMTVKALIGSSAKALHHHRAHDPGQSRNAEVRDANPFGEMLVTTSSWFDGKEDYLRKVAEKTLYIAPRRIEGIGMSFLEAMAMGKAVIAPDYPTMNEYIRHGRNGYLFDLQRPGLVDFGNVTEVRRNAYESVVAGRERWIKQSEEIVDWICQPIEERRSTSLIRIYADLGISPDDYPRINFRTLEAPVVEIVDDSPQNNAMMLEVPAVEIVDDSPQNNARMLEVPAVEIVDELEARAEESRKKAKIGSIRKILQFVARITLGELVSPKFYRKCARKLAEHIK